MKLSRQDADLFFKLMLSLQNYVNLKMGIAPDIDTVEEYKKLPSSQKVEVRDALYDNIGLVSSYLKENPQSLSAEELEIIEGWKKFQRGNYYIERTLKKYAIFIGDEGVYGVFALYDRLEDVLPYVRWPHYTKAVLLPFKGKIIYDGLLQGYRVSFGGGIKSNLKETYMAAKQNGRIIESFDPKIQAEIAVSREVPVKDFGPTMDEISRQVKKLRSSRGAPAIYSPAFSLAKASIEFAKLAVEDSDNIDELWRIMKKVDRAIRKAETVLNRAEYY